jgi:vancomycin aglycone glucosyltransferase
MKVLLSSIGTRGDVQPILALARELRSLGHEPKLCVPPNFKGWVESFGIPCIPVGPDLQQFTAAPTTVRPTPEQMQAMAAQSVRDQFRVLLDAARGCDVVVAASALQIAARSISELLRARYVFVAYSPDVFPSSELPPARTIPGGGELPMNADHRAAWVTEAQNWNARFLTTLNEERMKLDLPPVQDVMRHIFSDRLWLASDPIVGPVPETADVDVVQTGAWFMQDDSELPDSLQSFLDDGDPPVYCGFGSMRGANHIASLVMEAARALNKRVVFSEGWGGLPSIDCGADCICIGDVNHTKLFSRVAAVVHHGGAGTTHAAARAACPQVVLPHVYDQFYWAHRVQTLGIGVSGPTRARISTESLVTALSEALQSQTLTRARELSKAIASHGTKAAAEMLIKNS